MPLFPFLFSLLIFFAGMMFQSNRANEVAADTNEAAAINGNIRVYRNAVVTYAANNPTANGTISDAALNLPTWFVHMPEVQNVVVAGKAYVFYSTPIPGLAYEIVKSTNNSILVGINRGGFLANPLSGNTGISLPAAIPEGSIVYAAG